MAGGDARHSDRPAGRTIRRIGAVVVVVVVVLAVASFVLDLGPRFLGGDGPSPITAPAEVAPPAGLTLPEQSAAPAVAAATSSRPADPAAVRRALSPFLDDRDLGRRVAVSVGQPGDGSTLYETGPSPVTPASTLKLLTTTAALASLGPDHTFRTTVVAGASPREVVLVGGGDPLLARAPDGDAYPARADLVTLAEDAAASLRAAGIARVRLGYDTSLFTGPAVSPTWPTSYVSEHVVSPISPLWVDEGRERTGVVFRAEDPALAAAAEFARVLTRAGVVVRGAPRPARAPVGAVEHAVVRSAPLDQVAQWVLEVSDNEAAEVLFRHVALAQGRPGSFEAGSLAVQEVLAGLGVDTTAARILDGSGLSRQNRLAPATLLDVLDTAASDAHPDLRRVVTGLPVAGFTGSLASRMTTAPVVALGRVRAKTGTLTGVHGLAGLVTTRDGAVLSLAAVADRVRPQSTLDARERLDELAAALAACRCAA